LGSTVDRNGGRVPAPVEGGKHLRKGEILPSKKNGGKIWQNLIREGNGKDIRKKKNIWSRKRKNSSYNESQAQDGALDQPPGGLEKRRKAGERRSIMVDNLSTTWSRLLEKGSTKSVMGGRKKKNASYSYYRESQPKVERGGTGGEN